MIVVTCGVPVLLVDPGSALGEQAVARHGVQESRGWPYWNTSSTAEHRDDGPGRDDPLEPLQPGDVEGVRERSDEASCW